MRDNDHGTVSTHGIEGSAEPPHDAPAPAATPAPTEHDPLDDLLIRGTTAVADDSEQLSRSALGAAGAFAIVFVCIAVATVAFVWLLWPFVRELVALAVSWLSVWAAGGA